MAKRLTSADRATVEDTQKEIWQFVFALLDDEFGGEISGKVATAAEKAAAAVLSKELEVEA